MKGPRKLDAWRTLQGLTQAQAAERIGASQTAWNHWEAGKKKPDVDNAVRIEDLTDGAVRARDWTEETAPPKRGRVPAAADSSTSLVRGKRRAS